MDFLKYQHVERFGTTETNGIENGICYIFPKIDGTNAQIWKNNILMAGSRNRKLSLEYDNAGFYKWVLEQDNINLFFCKYPNLRLYGEWLVPHSLKTYEDSAWRKFYAFDVMNENEYLPYEEYKELLDEFDIEYIPPICKIENPTYERLINQLDKNGYLIKDGNGVGEGIVIKNYDYKNRFGNQIWAKIVTNDFKARHQKVQITEIKEAKIIEEEICKKYITKALIDKEKSKIENDNNGDWSSKFIPRLINTVFYCLVKEECWNFIKEFKNPIIDFKRLSYFCTQQIKDKCPEIF